ncbi:uncharacterized protein LOC126209886 [Schistocerca nitens]|uniref:uncharacterized protein LOC126209886 n=1 Tax=Schistocerca nitens TaxID=7011 RepID=UPI002117DF16|nr:uncharacterized protein LOC126209886 [Schistocerca nitens]
MRRDESIEQLADRIRNINAQTYELVEDENENRIQLFEADQRALDTFIHGLCGEEVNKAVRLEGCKIFQEAVEAAVGFVEALRRPNDMRKEERRVFNSNVECYRCNRPGHKRKDCKENRTCHKCGIQGHLARNCRNKKKPNVSSRQLGRSLNECGDVRATTASAPCPRQ